MDEVGDPGVDELHGMEIVTEMVGIVIRMHEVGKDTIKEIVPEVLDEACVAGWKGERAREMLHLVFVNSARTAGMFEMDGMMNKECLDGMMNQ